VFHRLEDRIRAHVILCWLALLCIRVAETKTGDTSRTLRHELDRLLVGEFTGNSGRVLHRTELTSRQLEILLNARCRHATLLPRRRPRHRLDRTSRRPGTHPIGVISAFPQVNPPNSCLLWVVAPRRRGARVRR
jgi:hypothetical protein